MFTTVSEGEDGLWNLPEPLTHRKDFHESGFRLSFVLCSMIFHDINNIMRETSKAKNIGVADGRH